MKQPVLLLVNFFLLLNLNLHGRHDTTLSFISEVSVSIQPYSLYLEHGYPGAGISLAVKVGNNPKTDNLVCLEYNTLHGSYSQYSHYSFEYANVTLFNAGISFIHRNNITRSKKLFLSWGFFFDFTIRNYQDGKAQYYPPNVTPLYLTYAGHVDNLNSFFPGCSVGAGYKIPVKRSMILISVDGRISFPKIRSIDVATRPTAGRVQIAFRIPKSK